MAEHHPPRGADTHFGNRLQLNDGVGSLLILALTAFIYLLPNLSGASNGVDLGIGNLTPEQVREFLLTLFPPDIANVITDQITHIQEQPPIGLVSISIVVLLWMASAVSSTSWTLSTRSMV